MPTYDNEILAAALLGYEQQKIKIETKIERLRAYLSGHVPPVSESGSGRKRSAATRKRMAAAQQRRWAAKNGEGAEAIPAESTATKKTATKKVAAKRTERAPLSAEARERIAAAQRKRWEAAKKAAKKNR